MVKVYNWIQNDAPPENPSVADMQYGVGYMVDLTVELATSMSELLKKLGETGEVDYSSIREAFESSTLGIQVKTIKKNYSGVELACSKMEHLVSERNYFVHRFRPSEKDDLSKDGKRLFNLLNLIYKVAEQFENAKKKVNKTVNKTKNTATNKVRNAVRSAASSCKQYKTGRINLLHLAQAMPDKIKWSGKFYKFLEQNGIPTYTDEKTNLIRYVKINEL